MTRLLVHAGALACALLASVLFYAALQPTVVEAATMGLSLSVIGAGLCTGRRHMVALVPAALAAAGLLLIGFSIPASAASKASPALAALQAPAQPLALAAPVPPQQVVVSVAPADAAERSISLPVADWTAAARNVLLTLLLGLWAFAKNKLPAPVLWAVKLYGEQKLIQQAVDLAVNAVPGAAKGVPLTIDVGNAVLAHALQWVINEVPAFAVKAMGGEDGIKAKIVAALHLEPDASAAALGIKTV